MELKTIKNIDYYLGNFLIAVLKPVVILLSLFLQRDHKLELRKSVTIIKLLGGGSLVIAFPDILGLRKKYPELIINLVTTKKVTPFAQSLNVFDNIFEVDDSSLWKFLPSLIHTYMKTLGTDTIIDLEVHSRLSTVFSLMTCARNRLGSYLAEVFWRRRIYTHMIYFNNFSGCYEFYDKIFQLFSVAPSSADECREHLQASLPKVAMPTKYRISIGHACSDLSKERMLDVRHWEKVFLAGIDKSFEAEIVFLGAEKDRMLASRIMEKISQNFPKITFINFCGKTSLNESISILSASNEFWGIDSSLVHYARLFKIKSVSFWGPTDPRTLLREVPGLQEEIRYSKIPCSPCIHVTETPPCMGDNICIQNLFSEEKREWPGLVT